MKIDIFDTTLRDGVQTKGISYTKKDKLDILKALDDLGVSFIEGGNPASNKTDYEFFLSLKDVKLKTSKVVLFTSTRKPGIKASEDKALNMILKLPAEYICVVGKSSILHVKDILKTSLKENIDMIYDTIKFLTDNNKKVIFDAESFFDGYAEDKEYAMKTLFAAKEAGAINLSLCDTKGSAFPFDVYNIVNEVKMTLRMDVGIHMHNDLGMGVSNSVIGVLAGANLVQGTLLGIGERCGNANLSAIIPNLQLKKNYQCIKKENMKKLTNVCAYIAGISDYNLPASMPYIGSNAFSHKAGMHTDGVIKNKETFEHMNPLDVGNETEVLFSDIGGRSALLEIISSVDNTLLKNSNEIISIVNDLKELEYEGYQYELARGSLELMVAKKLNKFKAPFETELFRVIDEHSKKGTINNSSALVKVKVGDQYEITADEGRGPVSALDNALRKAITLFFPELSEVKLIDYKVRVVDPSAKTGAKVRVIIESEDGKRAWSTIGVDEDIIRASYTALIDSIEYKLYIDNKKETNV